MSVNLIACSSIADGFIEILRGGEGQVTDTTSKSETETETLREIKLNEQKRSKYENISLNGLNFFTVHYIEFYDVIDRV